MLTAEARRRQAVILSDDSAVHRDAIGVVVADDVEAFAAAGRSRDMTGELGIGLLYGLAGFFLFRWFENYARRRGTLEAF